MSAIKDKALKVIVFSGKQDDWKFWEVKFLARTMQGIQRTTPWKQDDPQGLCETQPKCAGREGTNSNLRRK